MACSSCGQGVPDYFSNCPFCGFRAKAPHPLPNSAELHTIEDSYLQGIFRFAPVTFILIIVNVVMFWSMEKNGGSRHELTLLLFGAKFRPLVEDQEFWRLLTANFLHIGPWHLVLNLLTLVQLGTACENIYGRTRFFILYTLTGVSGFAASTWFSTTLSAGASAALFGLLGTLMIYGWMHSIRIPPNLRAYFTWYLLPWVIIMILFGHFWGGIDNLAHGGGLAAGMIFGIFFEPHPPGLSDSAEAGPLLRAVAWCLGIICLVSFWFAWVFSSSHLAIARANADERDLEGEQEVLSRWIDRVPAAGLFYYLRAEIRLELKNFPAAEEDLEQAIRANYRLPLVKNQLAWIMVTEAPLSHERLSRSLRLAQEALRLERSAATLNTVGWIHYLRGECSAAKSQLEKAYQRHSPHDPSGILDLYMLAIVLHKQGRTDLAAQTLEQAQMTEAFFSHPNLFHIPLIIGSRWLFQSAEYDATDAELDRFRRLAQEALQQGSFPTQQERPPPVPPATP